MVACHMKISPLFPRPSPAKYAVNGGKDAGRGREGGGKFIRRELLRNLTGPGSGGKG